MISNMAFDSSTSVHPLAALPKEDLELVCELVLQSGSLKGFKLGGAYRWQDEQILGYGFKDDLSGLDVEKPLFGESEDHIDLWVGYQRKIHERVTWRIQLNVRNVGESTDLTPISINPDGVIAAQRITEGMGWAVTNSFTF